MLLLVLLFSFLVSLPPADSAQLGGNLKGEGMVKGAIFVLGTREQGILACYLEELGATIDFEPIEKAMAQLRGAKEQRASSSASSSSSSSAAAASSSVESKL